MADGGNVDRLRDVAAWNAWRQQSRDERPDLRGANLCGANLYGANLYGSDLYRANLNGADLSGANLSGANLSRATLVKTRLDRVNLASARVYGVSVWDVTGIPAAQTDLIITEKPEAEITVDDLKIAQFIYLLLNNAEIRDVIDTITSKVVLILGAFSEARKPTLDRLRANRPDHPSPPSDHLTERFCT